MDGERAECRRALSPSVHRVDGHDRRDAGGPRRDHRAQPDRTAPHHDQHVAGAHPGTLDGLRAGRQVVGQQDPGGVVDLGR
jgi:hypothetical protein